MSNVRRQIHVANYASYRFPVPEAKLLASLESVRHDVEAVIEYCDRMHTLEDEPIDYVLWEAISAAAVVRYARCFMSGARTALKHKLLDEAPTAIRESHHYFIAVRSKHVAHSANEFEENDVTVTLREDQTSIEITGIGAHQGRVLGLLFNGPARLRELATWLLGRVHTDILAERAKLLTTAHEYGPQKIKDFGSPSAGTGASDRAATSTRSRP